jgi:Transmembrane secretion effector
MFKRIFEAVREIQRIGFRPLLALCGPCSNVSTRPVAPRQVCSYRRRPSSEAAGRRGALSRLDARHGEHAAAGGGLDPLQRGARAVEPGGEARARAVGIVFVATALVLPLAAALCLFPLLGVALNGTSSIIYGTVGELAPAERRARAFSIFYTLSIGSGALSPTLYGALSDAVGVPSAMLCVAALVLLTIPLTLPLRPALRALARG